MTGTSKLLSKFLVNFQQDRTNQLALGVAKSIQFLLVSKLWKYFAFTVSTWPGRGFILIYLRQRAEPFLSKQNIINWSFTIRLRTDREVISLQDKQIFTRRVKRGTGATLCRSGMVWTMICARLYKVLLEYARK